MKKNGEVIGFLGKLDRGIANYFEIEDDIISLKNISDKNERKVQLLKLLQFLGANPIAKVNKAFMAKFKNGILDYLNLTD